MQLKPFFHWKPSMLALFFSFPGCTTSQEAPPYKDNTIDYDAEIEQEEETQEEEDLWGAEYKKRTAIKHREHQNQGKGPQPDGVPAHKITSVWIARSHTRTDIEELVSVQKMRARPPWHNKA